VAAFKEFRQAASASGADLESSKNATASNR
jgi:hypothetical protein